MIFRGILTAFFVCLVTVLNAQTFTNYTTEDGLIDNTVSSLSIAENGDIWFGTQNGVSKFDGSTWTNYSTENSGLTAETITAIHAGSDNMVWIGTNEGVFSFDGSNWMHYTEEDGLADNRIKYISETLGGVKMFGNNDGLTVFNIDEWESFTQDDGLPFGGVNFVMEDQEEFILAGTPLGGYLSWDSDEWTAITEDEGLLNDKVRSIALDADRNRWVGTSDGISVFNVANEFQTNHEIIFELPPPDELNPVEDVQIDSKGNLWAAVYVDYLVTEGGVSVYNGSEWQDFDVEDGLVGPVVRRLAIDADDNVWVATSTGVSKISDIPDLSTAIDEVEMPINALYPNPTSSLLTISLKDARDLHVSQWHILDMNSRIVQDVKIPSGNLMQIDVSELPKGMYVLRAGIQSLRFVVN